MRQEVQVYIQRIGCQPKKTTLHGGQSRSSSGEQGKENKKNVWQRTPPPLTNTHTARSEKKKKNHAPHLQTLRKSQTVSRLWLVD